MSASTRRFALRTAALTATPAFAHVTAQPGTAELGGYSVVNLRAAG